MSIFEALCPAKAGIDRAVSSGQKRPKKRAALESYALSAPTYSFFI
jgi:hypothetical protein